MGYIVFLFLFFSFSDSVFAQVEFVNGDFMDSRYAHLFDSTVCLIFDFNFELNLTLRLLGEYAYNIVSVRTCQ